MSPPLPEGLRALIAETVREVVSDLVAASVRDAVPDGLRVDGSPSSRVDRVAAAQPFPTAPYAAGADSGHVPGPDGGPRRVETVRIRTDADLNVFVRHLLTVFEDPRSRQELRAGRYRFSLAPEPRSSPAGPGPARRVEQGAVTERTVAAAAAAGERLVLGRRAVLTPLARDKARKLGVHVEKER
ncbi:hypothetical protein ACI79G_21865 [Geodermatophilus sp. SYSU D00779]